MSGSDPAQNPHFQFSLAADLIVRTSLCRHLMFPDALLTQDDSTPWPSALISSMNWQISGGESRVPKLRARRTRLRSGIDLSLDDLLAQRLDPNIQLRGQRRAGGEHRRVIAQTVQVHPHGPIMNLGREFLKHKPHPFTRKKAARNPGRFNLHEIRTVHIHRRNYRGPHEPEGFRAPRWQNPADHPFAPSRSAGPQWAQGVRCRSRS